MLKKVEMSSPTSCLNKAASDEPVFVLRAKDRVAAMAVLHWATMAEGIHEQERIDEARMLAQTMVEWRNRNVAEPASSAK